MLIDSHIHIGQFYDLYTSPKELKQFLDAVDVERFAASSTTICEGNYDKVIAETKELADICGSRFLPVLWITSPMLKDGGLFKLMDSGIRWRCLKIHPQLHPRAWVNNSPEMKWVVAMASVLQMPLLIHTGEMPGCFPLLYEKTILDNPNVTFILAHGRPIGEAKELMKKHSNVWVDTAFMLTEQIRQLCDEKLSDRVLWGTDYPIPKYYNREKDMKAYYLGLVQELKDSVSQDDFELITHKNFEKLFG